MKTVNFLISVILLITLFSGNRYNNSDFYLPAEWEKQSGVMVGGLDDAATFEMTVELSKNSKVYCNDVDTMVEIHKKKISAAGGNIDNIYFIPSSTEYWYAQRDGIMFTKNGNDEKQIINFQWNAYGWYFIPEAQSFMEADKKDREAYLKVQNNTFSYPVISSDMVNEGGAIETNGKGTILQVETLNMQRNPDMTKEAQEVELRRVLNCKKIIWLKEGVAEDPFGKGALITENYFGIGVMGHLDEFCRFVNDSTILISFPDSAEAETDPIKKITLNRMKINYEILKNSTDQDGKPFTIIKMPVPDIVYLTFALDKNNINDEIKSLSKNILWEQKNLSEGDTVHFVPSCSYMNFLITNNNVFVPKYWAEGKPSSAKEKDEKVKQILQEYFPDRMIYQINTEETNHNGGGLHCWSMQVPE